MPYLIDLETSNGTNVNGDRIESGRYYELFVGDVVKFGFSTREYVFMDEGLAKKKKRKRYEEEKDLESFV